MTLPSAAFVGMVFGLLAVLGILWMVRSFQSIGREIDKDIAEGDL